jgi:hypothetical protein
LDTVTSRPGAWLRDLDRRALVLGAVVLVAGYLPLTFLGPGTDLDVGGVYHAGRSILDGDYQVSRLPGAPVFEALTAVLHAVGGTVAVNLVSMVMAAVTALAVARLVHREGHPGAAWFGLAVVVNPFVWVAGTSMVDFVWATALALTAANLQLSRRWLPAAAVYALAAGCRLSTLVLVAAFVAADAWSERDVRPQLAGLAASVVALTTLLFLPPFFQLGMGFLQSDIPVSPWLVQLGRFGVKNAFFFGPIAIAVVLWHLPRLWRAVPGAWTTSTVLRAGLLGFAGTQVLFLRFPWKLAHLIPALLCLLLVFATSRVLARGALVTLIVAQLVLALVTVNLARPDQPHEATGGRLAIEVLEGPWLRDLRCRLDGDRDAYRRPGAVQPLLDTWECVVPWSE